MKIGKEAIEQMLEESKAASDQATSLVASIQMFQAIQNSLNVYLAKKQRIREEHEKAQAKIDADIAALQHDCKHWQRTYHGDPAGGSDSHYECDVCGAIL